eukprot:CAMPEP_0196656298 /NCGR_PEP_ID=MMETSP1086-20130531/15463_1 /TAXON_ID=77921 /ORGANISM="Cyanoptyche  gloeocystis , Strain SAG4.97" /LENGTH=116 /DNA_ID=CAMNT_0041989003 /DNA_START=44 /DNA_END=394 /DNA_ORIENTATION=-
MTVIGRSYTSDCNAADLVPLDREGDVAEVDSPQRITTTMTDSAVETSQESTSWGIEGWDGDSDVCITAFLSSGVSCRTADEITTGSSLRNEEREIVLDQFWWDGVSDICVGAYVSV